MKNKLWICIMLVILLCIVGCQTAVNTGGNPDKKTNKQNTEEMNIIENEGDIESDPFPVTVHSADRSVVINKRPDYILPLSLDVTEIVLELVEPSKIVAISQSVEDPQLSTHTEKAKEIDNRVSSAVNIDPEEILSFNADLLLLTKMHGQEEEASTILNQVDLPVITFNAMGTVDAF